MAATNVVKTPLGEVYYEDGILFSIFETQEPTMEDAQKHQELVKANFGSLDLKLSLTDTSRGATMNKAIRDYLASDEVSAHLKATAVLVGGGAQKILGNLFLQFFKPKYEIKLFTEREKALEWLNSYK